MNRRNFMQNAVAGALASAATTSQAAPPAAPAASKMVGIQVGAVSFVDAGVNKVLAIFQQSASVNTLFVATLTYGRGIAGRQVPGQPLPTIVEFIERNGIDLLVIGYMGHSAIYKGLIGSTTDRLVALGPCHVLVAK